jgi:hypothetical protein
MIGLGLELANRNGNWVRCVCIVSTRATAATDFNNSIALDNMALQLCNNETQTSYVTRILNEFGSYIQALSVDVRCTSDRVLPHVDSIINLLIQDHRLNKLQKLTIIGAYFTVYPNYPDELPPSPKGPINFTKFGF